MLSPDNYVHPGLGPDGYNRYAYAGNNPLKYVDPSGEVVISSVLIGMAVGAAIGAASSSVMYTVMAGQNFTWDGLGRAALLGGISGAISGGIGALGAGSAFGQSLAFGVMRQSAGNISARLIMGEPLSTGMVVGGLASGLINGAIPGFTGVDGGPLANIGAELFYNASRGAMGGGIGGVIGAALDGGDLGQGMVNGAISGGIAAAVHTSLVMASWGIAFVPKENYGYTGKYPPVYRSGGIISAVILGRFEGTGIAVGRNLVVYRYRSKTWANFNGYKTIADGNQFLLAHETAHYHQQVNMGFAPFYAKAIAAQIIYSLGGANPYETPGTLEYGAEEYAKNYVFMKNNSFH